MQALKALVIFMGVLIVAGATLVAVTIYKRATHPVQGQASPGAVMGQSGGQSGVGPSGTAVSGSTDKGFGLRAVTIPAGAVVRRTAADGDRLLVELQLADGRPEVMVVSLRDGSVLGILQFAPGASSGSPAP